MMSYGPELSSPEKSPEWQVGEKINLGPLLYGLLPIGDHFVTVTMVNEETHTIKTQEHGGFIKEWLHVMTLQQLKDGSVEYRDTITINAGIMTRPVVLFAKLFYAHRHRWWRRQTKPMLKLVS